MPGLLVLGSCVLPPPLSPPPGYALQAPRSPDWPCALCLALSCLRRHFLAFPLHFSLFSLSLFVFSNSSVVPPVLLVLNGCLPPCPVLSNTTLSLLAGSCNHFVSVVSRAKKAHSDTCDSLFFVRLLCSNFFFHFCFAGKRHAFLHVRRRHSCLRQDQRRASSFPPTLD